MADLLILPVAVTLGSRYAVMATPILCTALGMALALVSLSFCVHEGCESLMVSGESLMDTSRPADRPSGHFAPAPVFFIFISFLVTRFRVTDTLIPRSHFASLSIPSFIPPHAVFF